MLWKTCRETRREKSRGSGGAAPLQTTPIFQLHGHLMKKHVVSFALYGLLCLVGLPAVCAAAADMNDITYYYMAPQPGKVPELFARVDTVRAPLDDGAVDPMGMFLAEVFALNPEVAEKLVAQRDKHSLRGRYAIAVGLFQAGLPKRQVWLELLLPGKRLESTRQDLLASEFRPMEEHPLESPVVLDALWGAFMASGKAVYVERIIAALKPLPPGKARTQADMVSMAAAWSLEANALQHDRVFAICEQYAQNNKVNPDTKKMVQGLVERVAAKRVVRL